MEGFTKTSLINYIKGAQSEIGISETFKGKEKKYTSQEITELIFPPNEEVSTPAIYRSVWAQKQMPHAFNKDPKTYKKPVFLRCFYDGENIKGYKRACMDATNTPSMSRVNYTWMYYYKVEGEDVAKSYWFATSDLIIGLRKVMKFYFREFPELQQMVDDGTLSPDDFRADPTIVLPLMDAAISSRPK
ncbi:MAG: hypothetical protein K2M88_06405 [Muribaculaceae bacterium]|nr:hypothetical protein [Muribaculaceae bacterium]